MKIFPSLVSADLLQLGAVIQAIDEYVDGYHLDIMDDHFVPNLTWGPAFIAALRKATAKPFQLHLMVDNPAQWIPRLAFNPGDSFVFHIEAVAPTAVHSVLDVAQNAGWKVGLALNPPTPVERVGQHLGRLDEILIMSVNPGFSGQGFIDTTYKIRQLHELAHKLKVTSPAICMDGGIGPWNVELLAKSGVQMIDVASAIFKGEPIANIQHLRQLTSCAC